MKSEKVQELVMREILKVFDGGDLSVAEITTRLNSVKWSGLPADWMKHGLSPNQVAWLVGIMQRRRQVMRAGRRWTGIGFQTLWRTR